MPPRTAQMHILAAKGKRETKRKDGEEGPRERKKKTKKKTKVRQKRSGGKE